MRRLGLSHINKVASYRNVYIVYLMPFISRVRDKVVSVYEAKSNIASNHNIENDFGLLTKTEKRALKPRDLEISLLLAAKAFGIHTIHRCKNRRSDGM